MDKEALLNSRLPEDDVVIPGIGPVRVRGLTRAEVLRIRKATDNDPATVDGQRLLVLEKKMLAAAMVNPEMSEADVARWQAVAPAGEIDAVILKVQELSGLMPDAERQVYKSFR